MKRTFKRRLVIILFFTFFGVAIVVLLFNISEAQMHHQNPFIRRYQQGTVKDSDADLDYNSYYFAGTSNDTVYLGNVTNSQLVAAVDTALENISKHRIHIDAQYKSNGTLLRVQSNNFYMIDGSMPAMYSGLKHNWKASLRWTGRQPFSQPQILDSLTIVCRTIVPKSNESELALIHLGTNTFTVYPQVLEKQVDGIFDNDGRLHYDESTQRIVYTYLYRNQFISTDTSLTSIKRGNTIDTISRADIKVAYLKEHDERKFSAPPQEVNKTSAVCGKLLFINSALTGRFEEKKIWQQASIIDVYDLTNNAYLSSFYVYHIDNQRLRSFIVRDNYLFALIGTHLVRYRLGNSITSMYKK